MADYKAKVQITAGVVGAELVDRFGNRLNAVGKTAESVNRQMSSLNGAVKMLAAGFGASQIAGLTAEFARATIQLDAYGKQLGVSFGAGAGGTRELEFLRETMRGLGIAQDEALGSAVRFTSALKLSGKTAQEANRAFESASKLILSNKLSADGANRVFYAMGQIASKGKLMSEELNGQLGDTLAGFTQQVANAMHKSTAQLLKDMQDGKVSSVEFFEALQKIGDGIDPAKLDSAARSVGNVKNAWFDLKSSIIDTKDIKVALDGTAGALGFLAEHADLVAKVIGGGLTVAFAAYIGKSIGSILATRADALAKAEGARAAQAAAIANHKLALSTFEVARAEGLLGGSVAGAAAEVVASSRAVAVATQEMNAATASASWLSRGAQGLVTMLGGPWGIAFAAAAGAVYLLSTQLTSEEKLEKAVEASGKALGDAQTAIAHLIDQRTGAHQRLTEAMRLQYLQELKLGAAKAATAFNEAKQASFGATLDANKGGAGQPYSTPAARTVGALMRGGARPEDVVNIARSLGVKLDQDSISQYTSAYNNDRATRVGLRLATGSPKDLDAEELAIAKANGFYTPDAPRPTAPVAGGTKTPRGAKPPAPERIDDQYATMLNTLTQDDLRTRNDLLRTTQERFDAEKAALAVEMDKRLKDIVSNKNFSNAQRETLTTAVATLSARKLELIEAHRHDELNREQTEAYTQMVDGQLEMLQLQEGMATTAAERRRIQLKILDAEEEIERAKLQEVITSKTASQFEQDRARARIGQLNEQRDTKVAAINDNTRSPLEQWKKQVPQTAAEMAEAMQEIEVNGLQSLSDGLAGVITGTKSVGEAFKSMADAIIADLARIAIQKLIVNALGGFFADGAAFSGGAKLFANGGAFVGGTEFFAAGGVVTRPTAFGMAGGKLGVMGEKDPEAIMPLRRLSNGRLGVEAVGAGGGTQNNVTVNVAVDGGGTDVQADGQHAAQLGRVISNVVRQELVNQSRPGGLLAR